MSLALTIGVAGARAQAPGPKDGTVDTRWQPWLGCWALLDDAIHEDAVAAPDEPGATAPISRDRGASARVCVTAAPGTIGVRMNTIVPGQPDRDLTIVADGSDRPLDDEACTGRQRAQWSSSGQHLFSRAEVQCAGEPPHSVSHLAMVLGRTWLDIQGITRDGRQGLRVRRYQRVNDEAGAPFAAGRSFGPQDVKDASGHVTSLVLQAALVESNSRFRLNGRTMLELDAAGVPDDVTDLMVALSYRDRFEVDRASPPGGGGGADPWGSEYDAWGFAPFTYGFWGYAADWYGQDVVIIGGGNGEGGGGRPTDGDGRVIKGRGYTRIEPVRTDAGGTRSTGDGGTTSATAPSSGDSGGGSSGVSSQGYSGGGGGDRTAQPRP
jgi:hypothetical protein